MDDINSNPANNGLPPGIRDSNNFLGGSGTIRRGASDSGIANGNDQSKLTGIENNEQQDSINNNNNNGKPNHYVERIEFLNSISSFNQELSYLRNIIEFQSQKVEKLTNLITDVLENKDQINIINSLQDNDNGDSRNDDQNIDKVIDDQDRAMAAAAAAATADTVAQQQHHQQQQHHRHQQQQQQHLQQQQQHHHHQQQISQGQHPQQRNNHHATNHLDNNMDPALSEVAQAAVQAQSDVDLYKKSNKRSHSKTKHTNNTGNSNNAGDNNIDDNSKIGSNDISEFDPESSNSELNSTRKTKKPKVVIEFLHNPMTVQEIYDEFNIGFKDQLPLKLLDQKYGKHEWRGDSRSKESKRFQRRKKLCDAIDRGVIKFDRTPQDIIGMIERFRGDKSLTWVMNGNFPPELQ